MSSLEKKVSTTEAQVVAPDGVAAERLEEMGYKQEMRRSLGMVSILGLSFAIQAVPCEERPVGVHFLNDKS